MAAEQVGIAVRDGERLHANLHIVHCVLVLMHSLVGDRPQCRTEVCSSEGVVWN